MIRRRAGFAAVLIACAVLLTAGSASAQQCVVEGVPVPGQECPSPTPTPSPSPSKSPTKKPSPSPSTSKRSTPSPRPTSSLVVVPPIVPIPSPTAQGSFGPAPTAFPTVFPTGQPYGPPLGSLGGTSPGLPVAPGDGRGLTATIVGLLGASGIGAYSLARSRVRSWMIGI